MKKIVVFASGSGSNAENIHHVLKDKVDIQCIFCNNSNAGVIERAKRLNIPLYLFNRENWNSLTEIEETLKQMNPDLIVLAGFLWKIPQRLIEIYPKKIINIHPSLLPKYGGKGMFGHHVHEAVIAANEPKSGITIHYVNEHYDEGEYILQKECDIQPSDSPDDLAQKIHLLEFEHFPKTIETILNV